MTDPSLWFLVLVGLLVGALVGAVGAVLALRRGDGASASRRELDAYRDEVSAHYAETARRVDALTQAYKAVYDHLEEGAYRLVGEDELKRRLDDASGDPVTLEGIGRRALDAGDAAAETSEEATSPRPPAASQDASAAEAVDTDATADTDEATEPSADEAGSDDTRRADVDDPSAGPDDGPAEPAEDADDAAQEPDADRREPRGA